MATGALLVFVDTMKELPVTLMLRPMNFETLATWLYASLLGDLLLSLLLLPFRQRQPAPRHALR